MKTMTTMTRWQLTSTCSSLLPLRPAVGRHGVQAQAQRDDESAKAWKLIQEWSLWPGAQQTLLSLLPMLEANDSRFWVNRCLGMVIPTPARTAEHGRLSPQIPRIQLGSPWRRRRPFQTSWRWKSNQSRLTINLLSGSKKEGKKIMLRSEIKAFLWNQAWVNKEYKERILFDITKRRKLWNSMASHQSTWQHVCLLSLVPFNALPLNIHLRCLGFLPQFEPIFNRSREREREGNPSNRFVIKENPIYGAENLFHSPTSLSKHIRYCRWNSEEEMTIKT